MQQSLVESQTSQAIKSQHIIFILLTYSAPMYVAEIVCAPHRGNPHIAFVSAIKTARFSHQNHQWLMLMPVSQFTVKMRVFFVTVVIFSSFSAICKLRSTQIVLCGEFAYEVCMRLGKQFQEHVNKHDFHQQQTAFV